MLSLSLSSLSLFLSILNYCKQMMQCQKNQPCQFLQLRALTVVTSKLSPKCVTQILLVFLSIDCNVAVDTATLLKCTVESMAFPFPMVCIIQGLEGQKLFAFFRKYSVRVYISKLRNKSFKFSTQKDVNIPKNTYTAFKKEKEGGRY